MYHIHLENSGTLDSSTFMAAILNFKMAAINFHLYDIFASSRRRYLVFMSVHMFSHTMNSLEAIRILYV